MKHKILQLFIVLILILNCIPYNIAYSNDDTPMLTSVKNVIDGKHQSKLPYKLFIPENQEKNKEYPLIIYLHDSGGNNDDTYAQLEEDPIITALQNSENKEIHPCYVLTPQYLPQQTWSSSIINYNPYSHHPPVVSESLQLVTDLIYYLKNVYNIDNNRIYIGGIGDGASGAWNLCANNPSLFAAVFALAGYTDPSDAQYIRHIPAWIFHGQSDRTVPVTESYNMVHELEELGADVQFSRYIHAEHDIRKQVSEEPDLFWWLFSQKKKNPSLSENITDLSDKDTSSQDIKTVVEKGLLKTDSRSRFYPEDSASLLDAISSLLICTGYEFQTTSQTFANTYLEKAVQLGILEPEHKNYSDLPISRELFANCVGSLYTLKKDTGFYKYNPIFKDIDNISPQYLDMITTACSKGIFDISQENMFFPDNLITRKELAIILNRIMNPGMRQSHTGTQRVFNGSTEKVLTTISAYDQSNDSYDNPGFIITTEVMGNLAADSLRHATDADISIIMKNEVTGILAFGDVTTKNISEIFHSGNSTIVIELNGEQILQMLDTGICGYHDNSILSVSGIKATYDSSMPKGKRVLYPRLDSIPLEPEQKYTVALSPEAFDFFDFLEPTIITDDFSGIVPLTLDLVGTLGINRIGIEDPRIKIKS